MSRARTGMTAGNWRWGAACLLFASLIFPWSPARAATQCGDIAVSPRPVAGSHWDHGYVEYRIDLTNRSAVRTHQVRLQVSFSGSSERVLESLFRQVELGPGASSTVSLFQPCLEAYGGGLSVNTGGRSYAVPLSTMSPDFSGYAVLLASRAVHDRLEPLFAPSDSGVGFLPPGPMGTIASHAPGHSTTAGGDAKSASAASLSLPQHETIELVRADDRVGVWSPNWLGYSRFDGILISTAEWREAPAEVRGALLKFAECGGSLLFFGPDFAPPPEYVAAPLADGRGWQAWQAGFGIVAGGCDLDEALTQEHLNFLAAAVRGSLAPRSEVARSSWIQNMGLEQFMKMPAGLMYLLVLGFAILAGPVAVIMLARRDRRIWLLWLVPCLSVVTCLALALTTILAEGLGGNLVQTGVTLLDQARHRAVSLGTVGFYCPVAPRDGLAYDFDTEVEALKRQGKWGNWNSVVDRSVLDQSTALRFSSGWLRSREPLGVALRKSADRRERLEFTRLGTGSLQLVNGLGVSLAELTVRDAAGRLYKTRELEAGERRELRPMSEDGGTGPEQYPFRDWYRRSLNTYDLHELQDRPERWLRPGTYMAVIDQGCPFLESGLDGVRNHRRKAVVYGYNCENL